MVAKRRFTTILSGLILGILAILLVACSPSSEIQTPESTNTITESLPVENINPEPGVTTAEGEPITVRDGLARDVVLPGPAQQIVSLAPSNTEILFAVGAGAQIIGRDEFSDYPSQAADLPSIGGGFGDYNLEAIVDLEPDLVLAAEINTAEQVKSLEDLGLTVFYLSNPTSLEEMYGNLLTIANLTGHSQETEALIESLRKRVSEVEAVVKSAKDIPTVFYELDATDPSAPWTAGASTFIDTLITMTGGKNIASDLEGQYLQISIEEIIIRDPQVILLGDAAYGVTPESLAGRTGWDELSAVVNNQIYAFDDNLASRPGPRLVEGMEQLAKLLHPELYPED
ncbi:MAG: cobalamin-binding protein [Chloroflexota bacterium]|nr:MAG: cobalamin-binding protein [Chloroflexota bacterium]